MKELLQYESIPESLQYSKRINNRIITITEAIPPQCICKLNACSKMKDQKKYSIKFISLVTSTNHPNNLRN